MKKILLLTPTLPFSELSNTKKEKPKRKSYAVEKTDANGKISFQKWLIMYCAKQEQNVLLREYNTFYEEGAYACAACNTELYYSKDKYDSKSGMAFF